MRGVLLTARKVVHSIHPLLMALQGKVGGRLPNAPHLDRAVQGGAGKCVCVLGIESDLHNSNTAEVCLSQIGFIPDVSHLPLIPPSHLHRIAATLSRLKMLPSAHTLKAHALSRAQRYVES